MKKYILLTSLLMANSLVFAQAEFDALKYSLTDINGSARYVSMSGAFGALGGDMSTLGMNPAGIAVYRSSELSLTPSLSTLSTKSVFNGYESTDSKSKMLINNFGYVGSFRTYDESSLSNFNFGISYNKVKDFNRNSTLIGKSHPKTLLDRICIDENNGGSSLYDYAYETWLVEKNSSGNCVSILSDGETATNAMYMMESGGIGEWNFTLGANYNHNLYLGLSLGVQSIDYELKSVYDEDFAQGGGLELRNVLSTQGAGVNLKIGAIVRLCPELRIGLAYHTPTYYSMTDNYGASMTSSGLIDPVTNKAFDPAPEYYPEDGSTDYQLKTPGRLMYSMAYQFGKTGFISMDWDVVDYRETTLKDADGVPFGDLNGYMNDDFRAASNLRLGGELRVSDNFSLRAGTAWYQSPVKASLENNNTYVGTAGTTPQYSIEKDTYYASCGFGYHSGAFFLDAALQEQMRSEHFYNFYDEATNVSYKKYADLSSNKTNVVVTVGLKF